MNLIAVANETIKISQNGGYAVNGAEVRFPTDDYGEVEVYSPERISEIKLPEADGEMCGFKVINADSFEAASAYENPLVMNFANSHVAGGGFRLGATAQEEALCRNSTLYASINSKKAKEMYSYNIKHFSPTDSDYMLLSPCVYVFRNAKCELIAQPFKTGVITIPAPNKRAAAMLTPQAKIDEVMTHRIRLMLNIAAENGYKNLVLGAWGCGAFGNDPAKVAGYFKQVLVNEGMGKYFDEVCFAVYGKADGRNITKFREEFDQLWQ